MPGALPTWAPPLPPAPSQTFFPAPLTGWVPLATTARFQFQPSFWLSEQYNDNFNLTPTDRVTNWRTTVGAGLNLNINDVKTQGYLSAGLGGSWDTALGGNFTLFPTLQAAVTHTVDPRLSFTLTDSLQRNDQYAQSDRYGVIGAQQQLYTSNTFTATMNWLIDRIQTTAFYSNSLFYGTSSDMSNIFGVNVGVPVGLDTTISVGYQFWLWNALKQSATAGDDQNVGNTFFATISRRVGQYGSAGISGSYNIQTQDDAKIWNVSAFGTYGTPAGLSVSASVGYGVATSDTGVDDGRPTTNTMIAYSFGRAIARLWAIADFQPSFVVGQNLGVLFNKEVGASFFVGITPLLSTYVYGRWSQTSPTGIGNNTSTSPTNTYSAGTTVGWGPLAAAASVSYSDSVILGSPGATQFGNNEVTVNGSLTYQVLTFLSAYLNYQYLTRDDNGSGGGKVTQNLVTVGLSASF